MAEQEIVVKLTLDSDLKAKFADQSKTVQEETGKMSGVMGKLGVAIAAAFTVEKIIAFGTACVDAYDESAQAATKLNTALGYTSTALDEQAKALQKTTRFGDDAITSAQALLAMYGLTEAQIKKLTPTVLDYASATGTDLNSAADKVGRSIATSTNALARQGIQISDSTSKSQRLSEVVGALNERYHDQAKAMGDIGKGPAIILSNAFNDLMEDIGQIITESPTFKASLLIIADSINAVSGAIKYLRGEDKNPFSLMTDEQLTKEQARYAALADSMQGIIQNAEVGTKAFDQAFKSLGEYGSQLDKIEKEQTERDKLKKAQEGKGKDTISKVEKVDPITGMSLAEIYTFEGKVDTAFDKIIAERNDKILTAQQEKNEALFENERAAAEKRVKLLTDYEDKQAEIYEAAAVSIGEATVAGLGKGAEGLKISLKAMLTSVLSAIEKKMLLGYVGAGLDAVLLWDFSGLAKMAGITAAFEAAKIGVNAFALGGDFVTRGPQMIMVGDNPGGRERVSVTPLSSQNVNGPSTGNINMGNVYIQGSADSSTVKAINQSREKQLKNFKKMFMELTYANQMP